MNKMVQQAPGAFRGRMYQSGTQRRKEQRILVLKTGVAGLQHYIENEEDIKSLLAIQPGDELILFREPQNQYDEWAIAVHLTKEKKIGFVTRYKNESIARMMDAGKRFVAIVDSKEPPAQTEGEKKPEPYNYTTENFNLPFSIYLIEND